MAITKQVDVIISAVDQYSPQVQHFGDSVSGIGIAAAASAAAIAAMGAAAAALPITMGKDFYQAAGVYYDYIIEIVAVTQEFGTTSAEIEGIMDRMAVKLPVTGKEVGEVMKEIAQMGFGAKQELEDITLAAIQLGIATETGPLVAAKAITQVMNMWGRETYSTNEIINTLAAAALSSAGNVSDMAEALKYAGPMAVLAGHSLQETSAALAMLKDRGLEASQTGTTLRMGLAQLFNETTKGTAVLEKYGLTFADVNPEVKSLAEITEILGQKQLGAKDATDLLGLRGMMMNLIFKEGGVVFQEYVDKITGTNTAIDAFDVKMTKLSNVLEGVNGDLDRVKKEIGEGLVSAVIKLIGLNETEGLRALVTTFGDLEEKEGTVGKLLTDLFNFVAAEGAGLFTDTIGSAQNLYDVMAEFADVSTTALRVLAIVMREVTEALFNSVTGGQAAKEIFLIMYDSFALMAGAVAFLHDAFSLLVTPIQLVFDAFEYGYYKIEQHFAVLMGWLNELALWLGGGTKFEEGAQYWEERNIAMKKGMEDAFDTAPVNFWFDNVIRATTRVHEEVNAMGSDEKAARIAAVDGEFQFIEVKKQSVELSAQMVSHTREVAGLERELAPILSLTNQQMELYNKGMLDVKNLTAEQARTLYDMLFGIEQVPEYMLAFAQQLVSVFGASENVKESLDGWGVILDENGNVLTRVKLNMQGVTAETTSASVAAGGLKDKLTEMQRFELKFESEKFNADMQMQQLKIKTASDLIKEQLQWEAKLEIAQLEADTKKAVAAFDSIGKSVQSTSAAVASMFGDLVKGADTLSMRDFGDMMKLLEKQIAIEEALAKAQIVLVLAQAEQMKAVTERAKSGEALWTVNVQMVGQTTTWMDGLLQEMLKQIMIKASSEAFSCMGKIGG